jgi:membrane protein
LVLRVQSWNSVQKEGVHLWAVLRDTYNDFDQHNSMTYAGSLAFFFLLSVFPLMIFLAALLAFIPIPNLFEQSLQIMSKVVPPDAMGVVRGVLRDVLRPNTGLLSFSIISALFAASGGFASLITALNVAYDVGEGRPYWKKRLVAFGLTILTGMMVAIVLVAIALGPEFGSWLADKIHASGLFFRLWPYFRWLVIAAFTVLSVETIYFLGPNVKQRFQDHVAGAIVAVLSWIGISWGLGWYLAHFAHYNQTFGTLGAVVGLMLWFYVTAITLMLGAELNSELAKARGRVLPEKEPVEEKIKPPLLLPERTSQVKSA